ncbi:MAG: type IV secretory system conjugative DNA transfer family protein [Bacteroidetes bacterium]|nr:type IV secretory system conjugative DNA transfer family protein [Bacteroidota bacterium]
MQYAIPYLRILFDYCIATCKLAVGIVTNSVWTAFDSFEEKDSRTYKASFGEKEDLLSSSHGGFCLTGTEDGCLSRHASYENVLVFGQIGTGKTASIGIPSAMYIRNASLVINCPSGQSKIVAPYLASKGVKIKLLRFDDPYHSDSFNVFDYITSKSDRFVIAFALAGFLKPGSGDNFWQQQTKTLLYVFISILDRQKKEFKNMANLKALVNKFAANQRSLDKLFAKVTDDDDLIEDYKGIIAMEEKVLKSVVASAQAALQLWYDDAVCKSTYISTLDLSQIRTEATCIIIETPIQNSRMYAPLISLFFEFALRTLMAKLPEKKDLDVFFIIDEASNLRLESLGDILNNCRKYRCGIMTLWQSSLQIDHNFGSAEGESIRNASRTKVYLSGAQDLKTSEELESLLGKSEYLGPDGKSKVKPLMLSQDIRAMKPEEALIISSRSKPLKVSVTPYFRQPFLMIKLKGTPFKVHNTAVPKVIPILNLG